MPSHTDALNEAENRHLQQSYDAYQKWIQHLVALSSGGLTLLISLQSHYLPQNPSAIWMLQASWILLAIATISGIVAVYAPAKTHMDAAVSIRIARMEVADPEAYSRVVKEGGTKTRSVYTWSAKVLFVSFVMALISLVAFACINTSKKLPNQVTEPTGANAPVAHR